MKTSSSILAERVIVEVPQVNISGSIQGNSLSIIAATLFIDSDGVLLSSDRSNTSTSVTINVDPSNLIQVRRSTLTHHNPLYPYVWLYRIAYLCASSSHPPFSVVP
jgi:hypothetical protein